MILTPISSILILTCNPRNNYKKTLRHVKLYLVENIIFQVLHNLQKINNFLLNYYTNVKLTYAATESLNMLCRSMLRFRIIHNKF